MFKSNKIKVALDQRYLNVNDLTKYVINTLIKDGHKCLLVSSCGIPIIKVDNKPYSLTVNNLTAAVLGEEMAVLTEINN